MSRDKISGRRQGANPLNPLRDIRKGSDKTRLFRCN